MVCKIISFEGYDGFITTLTAGLPKGVHLPKNGIYGGLPFAAAFLQHSTISHPLSDYGYLISRYQASTQNGSGGQIPEATCFDFIIPTGFVYAVSTPTPALPAASLRSSFTNYHPYIPEFSCNLLILQEQLSPCGFLVSSGPKETILRSLVLLQRLLHYNSLHTLVHMMMSGSFNIVS